MKGWIYRRAVSIREAGERMAHKKVLGVRVLYWLAIPVITLGLAIHDWALKYPIRNFL